MAEGKFSDPTDNEKALEERVRLLQTALAQCEAEKVELVVELTSTSDKFDACREAFDYLLDELHQEGM